MTGLAGVGEPEPATPVEDDVVGPAQRAVLCPVIQPLDGAGCEVHALDASAGVVFRLPGWAKSQLILMPGKAAVVTHVALPVRGESR